MISREDFSPDRKRFVFLDPQPQAPISDVNPCLSPPPTPTPPHLFLFFNKIFTSLISVFTPVVESIIVKASMLSSSL